MKQNRIQKFIFAAAFMMTALFASLGAFSAWAQTESTSRFSSIYWQPGANQNGVTGGVGLGFSRAKLSGTVLSFPFTGESSSNSTDLGLEYDRGLSESLAVGVGTGWATSSSNQKTTVLGTTSESNSKTEGLNNLRVILKGRGLFENSNGYYYGLSLSVSPGDRTYDAAADSSNNFSGGYSLLPYIGAHFIVNPNVLVGGQVSYSLPGERKTKISNPTSESTTTGGNSLSLMAFLELPNASWHPTFQLNYSKSEKTKTTSSSGDSESDGQGVIAVQANAEFEMKPGFDLLPAVTYGTLTEKTRGGTTFDSFDIYLLSLTGRFIF
jgi:hypothetical protein